MATDKETVVTLEKPIVSMEEKPLVSMEENPIVIVEEKPTIERNETIATRPTTKKSQATATIPKNALGPLALCGSTVALVGLGVFAILPLLEVLVGRYYAENCPVNRKIPHYLVVTGSVGLATIILTIIQGLVSAAFVKPALKAVEEESGTNAAITTGLVCIFCGISFVIFALSIFLFGWSIAGCVWVFGAWNKVQYNLPDQPNYCHPTLYRFTYWLFLIPLVLTLTVCCCPFCVACITGCKNKKKGAQRVPTLEP